MLLTTPSSGLRVISSLTLPPSLTLRPLSQGWEIFFVGFISAYVYSDNMSRKDKKQMTDAEVEDTARYVALETFGMIEDVGEDRKLDVTITYLAIFVGSLVLKSLVMTPNTILAKKELIDFTEKNFKNMKVNIQNAVALAFKSAVEDYSGKDDADYYCQIKPMPQPTNKTPC